MEEVNKGLGTLWMPNKYQHLNLKKKNVIFIAIYKYCLTKSLNMFIWQISIHTFIHTHK